MERNDTTGLRHRQALVVARVRVDIRVASLSILDVEKLSLLGGRDPRTCDQPGARTRSYADFVIDARIVMRVVTPDEFEQ